ncbi:Holliday junction resolvase [Candidatus Scalindua japonica]|uniref:Putative pre-16S rRNA nuclease n=1 Tax=Candidatus Scalindua japonica TaxID=1284222 RepID=A0A286TV35_9BACT|nr:Holliday junction resolvase RuvX [Candidatus Scalindua japonica]GAX59743.1 Holliday junction resolvase [Candidatus Scalindua japonica]
MRTLGIDYGNKRVGLAISTPVGGIAQGLQTIERIDGHDYLEELAEVIKEKEVGEIVVGLPKNMNDTIGEKAEEVLVLVETLKSKFNIPVHTIDERLTTVRANRAMAGAKMTKKGKKKRVDMIAAQFILQSYLDQNRRNAEEDWEVD